MNSGKRKNISLDDYVIAALMIYFDWVNVFRTCVESCKLCRQKASDLQDGEGGNDELWDFFFSHIKKNLCVILNFEFW